ncbi:MAG: FkbM family methyltransferase [Phycisphaerales bacterium]|nr:FkbM family methyltransferase [Phycisphaerales bacterium]
MENARTLLGRQMEGSMDQVAARIALVLCGVLVVVVALLIKEGRLTRKRQRWAIARLKIVEADLLRLRSVVYKGEAKEELRAAGRQAVMPIRFTAEWGEDVFLWDLFDRKLTGFYIEVGAFDGYTLSVTYPFESMGWTGLLVEAIPERFQACAARRARSRVVHAAVSKRGSSGTTRFSLVEGGEENQMLSYLSTNDPHRDLLKDRGERERSVTVPLTTMDALLGELAPGTIDFAVIDVEGGEPDLLDGFDLKKHQPRVLLIEDLSEGKDEGVGQTVGASGYVMAGRVGRNNVFVRREEAGLLKRARELTAVLN